MSLTKGRYQSTCIIMIEPGETRIGSVWTDEKVTIACPLSGKHVTRRHDKPKTRKMVKDPTSIAATVIWCHLIKSEGQLFGRSYCWESASCSGVSSSTSSSGIIGVIPIHALKDLQCIGTEILLVNDSVVADHECHHACHSVFSGGRCKSKPANHRSFNNVVHLP